MRFNNLSLLYTEFMRKLTNYQSILPYIKQVQLDTIYTKAYEMKRFDFFHFSRTNKE